MEDSSGRKKLSVRALNLKYYCYTTIQLERCYSLDLLTRLERRLFSLTGVGR